MKQEASQKPGHAEKPHSFFSSYRHLSYLTHNTRLIVCKYAYTRPNAGYGGALFDKLVWVICSKNLMRLLPDFFFADNPGAGCGIHLEAVSYLVGNPGRHSPLATPNSVSLSEMVVRSTSFKVFWLFSQRSSKYEVVQVKRWILCAHIPLGFGVNDDGC